MEHIVAAGAYSSQPSFDLSLTVNLCRASLRVVPAALDEITHRCRATFIWCASSAAHRRRATFPTASHHPRACQFVCALALRFFRGAATPSVWVC